MTEAVDRLPDGFWIEEELEDMSDEIINPSRTDATPKHLCWYHLLKEGEYTYKAVLLPVESVVDGQDAVNKAIAETGLTAIIGDYGEESPLNGVRAEELYRVLAKYQYIPDAKFNGSDKIFTYQAWMKNLV